MRPWILIAAGVAGLGLVTLLGRTSAKAKRIVLVGDSHSEADWTFGGRVVEGLREQGAELVVREGNRGKGVSWYLGSGRLSSVLAEHTPDTLIVELGGNDAGRYNEAQYKALLGQFVGVAGDAGVQRLIWLGPTKFEGDAAKHSRRMQVADWQSEFLGSPEAVALGSAMDVTWFAMEPVTREIPTRDGVHYDQIAYKQWASDVLSGALEGLVL